MYIKIERKICTDGFKNNYLPIPNTNLNYGKEGQDEGRKEERYSTGGR